jgi:hypothetical protein
LATELTVAISDAIDGEFEMLMLAKWPLPIELVIVAIPFVLTLIVIAAIGAAIGYCLSLLMHADTTVGTGIGMWGAIIGAVGGKLAQIPMKFQIVDGIDPILGMPLDVFVLAAIGAVVFSPLTKALR